MLLVLVNLLLRMMMREQKLLTHLKAILEKPEVRKRTMANSNGFSDATKTAIAILQRVGKINLTGEICPWCKLRPADEVDYIEAKSKGGANSPFNGMWICGTCNRKKSAQPLEDWIDYVRGKEGIGDVEAWLRCKDKNEYHVLVGRKLRKEIGWRESDPPEIVEEEPVIVPRPNPINALNAPVQSVYDIFSNDRLIQHLLFGCGRGG
jgi:HNH endonuclease